MIISHERKYIFVHIPKTGGTSLAHALEGKAKKTDILIGDTPKAIKRRKRLKGKEASGRLWKHSKICDIYGLVDQEQIEAYFVFTLVRNPWDRMVSYYHWLRIQKFDHPHVKLAQELEFSPFLNNVGTRLVFQGQQSMTYVQDRQGANQCDLFLRLEHLAQDVEILEDAIGMRFGLIPHENKSDRGAYQAYYTEADAALIAQIFATDIAQFGYRF